MKNTLLVFAILVATLPAHAFDMTGIDLKEIPIHLTPEFQKERIEMLYYPQVSFSQWSQLSTEDQNTVTAYYQARAQLAQEYLLAVQKQENEIDKIVKPEVLCPRTFGAGYSYTGRVESEGVDKQIAESYTCTKFGPSQRTPAEKRMIAFKGYLQMLRFKFWHPLTAWPG